MRYLLAFLISVFLISPSWGQYYAGPFGDQSGDIDAHTKAFKCQETTTPGNPASDQLKFYCKDNAGTTALYTLDSNGSEVLLGSGGSYATADAQSDTGWTKSGTNVTLTTSTDNVGIGSATPGQKLDVSGNVRIVGSNSLFFGNTNRASIANDGTDANSTLVFSTHNASGAAHEDMRLSNAGNMGIGTFTPVVLLHVGAGGDSPDVGVPETQIYATRNAATAIVARNSSSNVEVSLRAGANNSQIDSSANTFIIGGSATKIQLSTSGNVGVNSASPGQTLDVQGTVRATGISLPTGHFTKSFVITSATSASDFGNILRAPLAMTIKAVHCLAVGGTNVVGQLQECDSAGLNCADVDSDMTCTAATNVNDDGSLSNPSIDAGDYLGIKTTSVSGSNSNISWTFEYTVP